MVVRTSADTGHGSGAADSTGRLDRLGELRHRLVASDEPLGYQLDAHRTQTCRDV